MYRVAIWVVPLIALFLTTRVCVSSSPSSAMMKQVSALKPRGISVPHFFGPWGAQMSLEALFIASGVLVAAGFSLAIALLFRP